MGEGRKTLQEMEELVPQYFRDTYPGDARNVVNEYGEPVSMALVEYSYTREGRRLIGVEFPNPVPVEAPFQVEPHEEIYETIRRMVLDRARQERMTEQEEEFETEEEANDFDTGDDYDPASPWEDHHEATDPWPMSSAARQLEQAIHEKRSQGRIAVLKEELEALQNGKDWPPKPVESGPATTPPAGPPPASTVPPKPA